MPYVTGAGPAHRTDGDDKLNFHMIPKSGVRSVRSPAASPPPRLRRGIYQLPATSYVGKFTCWLYAARRAGYKKRGRDGTKYSWFGCHVEKERSVDKTGKPPRRVLGA